MEDETVVNTANIFQLVLPEKSLIYRIFLKVVTTEISFNVYNNSKLI